MRPDSLRLLRSRRAAAACRSHRRCGHAAGPQLQPPRLTRMLSCEPPVEFALLTRPATPHSALRIPHLTAPRSAFLLSRSQFSPSYILPLLMGAPPQLRL